MDDRKPNLQYFFADDGLDTIGAHRGHVWGKQALHDYVGAGSGVEGNFPSLTRGDYATNAV